MDCFFCDPGGARTLDPLIKSQLLYQLSYGYIPLLFASAIIVQAESRSQIYLNYAEAKLIIALRVQSYNFFLIYLSNNIIFF